MKLKGTQVLLLLLQVLFASFSLSFWRMPCGNFKGVWRIDPMVNPGVPSTHAHAIHGGSAFSFTSSSSDLVASDCTSCSVKQDKSAYWVAPLYFHHVNGTFQVVPQRAGILIYYLQRPCLPVTGPNGVDTCGNPNVTAFPTGFRMIAGDTNLRNYTWEVPYPEQSLWTGAEASQPALRQKALGFNCMEYNLDHKYPTNRDEAMFLRHFMPNKTFLNQNCRDGMRLEVAFPSCWNGKDLDSKDHRSHVAYPSLVQDGTCPDGFPIRLPTLLYETLWNTHDFAGLDGQFVLSNGDYTGFGNHADFITGWDPKFLQQALDQCTNLSDGNIQDCPLFTLQDQNCDKFSPPAFIENENCNGPMEKLCGNAQSGSSTVARKTVTATRTVGCNMPTASKRHIHGHHH